MINIGIIVPLISLGFIGIFNRIVAFSKMNKKPLSINDCKIILKDVHNNNKVISIDKIQNVIFVMWTMHRDDSGIV